MNPREEYFKFFEDIARRNRDIAHQEDGRQRFFLEQEYNVIQGGGQLYNLGWNMLLEGYDGRDDDNRADSEPLLVKCAFSILKHCKREDSGAHTDAYNDAFLIGWEICNHITAICYDRENAAFNRWIGENIALPAHLVRRSIEFLDVGPRFDQYYGMRFTFDMRQLCGITTERVPDRWKPI